MMTEIRRYYHRVTHYNRGRDDIQRQLLNCLNRLGPTPVTHLLYRIALSHGQAKVYLNELIDAGLVRRKPLETMLKEVPKAELGRLVRMSDNVIDVYLITKKGEKYLNKLNEMEVMITWDR